MNNKNFVYMTDSLNKITDTITRNGVITETKTMKPYVRISQIKNNIKILVIDKDSNNEVFDVTDKSKKEMDIILEKIKKIFI